MGILWPFFDFIVYHCGCLGFSMVTSGFFESQIQQCCILLKYSLYGCFHGYARDICTRLIVFEYCENRNGLEF